MYITLSLTIGGLKLIPTPSFRLCPSGRKHRNTQENKE